MIPLSALPKAALKGIFLHLCSPSSPLPSPFYAFNPYQPQNGFDLAQTSTRMLSVFAELFLSSIDARISTGPISPSDFIPQLEAFLPGWKAQSALHLASILAISSYNLRSLRLPAFRNEIHQHNNLLFANLNKVSRNLQTFSFTHAHGIQTVVFPSTLQSLEIHHPGPSVFQNLLQSEECKLADVTFTGLRPYVFDALKIFLLKVAPHVVSLKLAFDTGIKEPPLEQVSDVRMEVGKGMVKLKSLAFLTSERYFRPYRHFQDTDVNTLDDTLMFLSFTVDDMRSESRANTLSYLCVDASLDSIGTNLMPFNTYCDANTRIQVETLNGTLVFPPASDLTPYFESVRNFDLSLSLSMMRHAFSPLRRVTDITIGEKSVQALLQLSESDVDEGEHAPNVEGLPVLCGEARDAVLNLRARFDVCSAGMAKHFLTYLSNSLSDTKCLALLELPGQMLQWFGDCQTRLSMMFKELRYVRTIVMTERVCQEGHTTSRVLFLKGLIVLLDILNGECPFLELVCSQSLELGTFQKAEEPLLVETMQAFSLFESV